MDGVASISRLFLLMVTVWTACAQECRHFYTEQPPPRSTCNPYSAEQLRLECCIRGPANSSFEVVWYRQLFSPLFDLNHFIIGTHLDVEALLHDNVDDVEINSVTFQEKTSRVIRSRLRVRMRDNSIGRYWCFFALTGVDYDTLQMAPSNAFTLLSEGAYTDYPSCNNRVQFIHNKTCAVNDSSLWLPPASSQNPSSPSPSSLWPEPPANGNSSQKPSPSPVPTWPSSSRTLGSPPISVGVSARDVEEDSEEHRRRHQQFRNTVFLVTGSCALCLVGVLLIVTTLTVCLRMKAKRAEKKKIGETANQAYVNCNLRGWRAPGRPDQKVDLSPSLLTLSTFAVPVARNVGFYNDNVAGQYDNVEMESSVSQAWKGPQTSRVSMFQSGSQFPLAEMTVAEREKLEESSYEVLHSAKDSYHCNVGHSHTACPSAADPCYCNVGHSHTASPSAKDPCYSNVGHPPTPSPSASGDNNMAAPLNGSGSEPPPYYNTPKTAHPKPAATSLGDYSYNYVDMSSAIPSAGREIKMEKNVAYFTPGLPQKRN